jgi:hypothetical protein
VAQKERTLISKRTAEALAAAKARGVAVLPIRTSRHRRLVRAPPEKSWQPSSNFPNLPSASKSFPLLAKVRDRATRSSQHLYVLETLFAGSHCVLVRRRNVAEGTPRNGERLPVLIFQVTLTPATPAPRRMSKSKQEMKLARAAETVLQGAAGCECKD